MKNEETERYRVIDATPDHVSFVADRMRASDRAEVWAAARLSPYDALRVAVEDSAQAWTGLVGNEPVCLFGAAPGTLVSGTGVPWLLATNTLEKHGTAFLRRNRDAVKRMTHQFSRLENWVDARNVVSRRWLMWLGFHCEAAVPYGASGLLFHRFWMERSDV